MVGRLAGRQKSSTLAHCPFGTTPVLLGRERLLPPVLSDTDADTGIARVAAGATALPFSLRSFA